MTLDEALDKYIELQKNIKFLQDKQKEIKGIIVEALHNSKEPIVKGNKQFTLQKRTMYKYNVNKLKELVDDKVLKVIVKEEVDIKKMQGLVKGKIINPQVLDQAKEVVRETEALVVRDIQ